MVDAPGRPSQNCPQPRRVKRAIVRFVQQPQDHTLRVQRRPVCLASVKELVRAVPSRDTKLYANASTVGATCSGSAQRLLSTITFNRNPRKDAPLNRSARDLASSDFTVCDAIQKV
jgi:hypothetical protein